MKVLVVDHNAILKGDRELYRSLNALPGFEVTVLVPNQWKESFGKVRYEKEGGGLRVFATKTLFGGRSHRALYYSLSAVLKRVQPDIIYLNSEPEGFLAWQGAILRDRICASANLVVNSWRNIDYADGRFPYQLPWMSARAERLVLAKADWCVVHTRAAKEIFARKGFPRVTIIPAVVNRDVFRRHNRRLPGTNEPFKIGFVGRFIELKGVDLLLKAASRLTIPYRLILVGDGPAKARWKRLAHDLGIAHNVIWKDAVPHTSVPEMLNQLDVVVLPSVTGGAWKEQFGRILIEAMSCEVAVIGSDSGEIAEVIGNAGIVFWEGDAEALALGLLKLYDDADLRQNLVRKGAERVQSKFSIPVVAPLYATLFQSLKRR